MSRISRTRRIVLFWAAAAFIAALEAVLTAGWLVGATSPRVYATADDIPARMAGLLLGCPEYSNGRPNPVFAGRIRAAADLYHAGKIRTLVVSGASRPKEFYDEIPAMTNALISLGVPENVIVRDDKGLRTLDSVLRMHDVFACDDFIAISQRGHCERALYLADHHGISAIGFAAGIQPDPSLSDLCVSGLYGKLACVKAVLDVAVNRPAKYPTER